MISRISLASATFRIPSGPRAALVLTVLVLAVAAAPASAYVTGGPPAATKLTPCSVGGRPGAGTAIHLGLAASSPPAKHPIGRGTH